MLQRYDFSYTVSGNVSEHAAWRAFANGNGGGTTGMDTRRPPTCLVRFGETLCEPE